MSEFEMSAERKPRTLRVVVVAPGLLVAVLGAAICGFEALHVGPLAGPGVVDAYHFGSDAMVGEGGPHYASRSIYVRTAAAEGIGFSLVAVMLIAAVVRHSALWAVGGYVGLAMIRFAPWAIIQKVIEIKW